MGCGICGQRAAAKDSQLHLAHERISELEALLRKYGRHEYRQTGVCPALGDTTKSCTCGWSEVEASLPEEG